ncbi:MAG: hypothetical protein MUF54_09005, partial [Polyangiaceae bacterium]|nr:hypothetical protein [Polyangiaceae bacterium]
MQSGTQLPVVSVDAAVRVCPACRVQYSPPSLGAAPVEFCDTDGFALVRACDFERSGCDPMLGRTVAGRFTVIARLGTGSMGAVYRAWQGTVGRWVALKIMRYDRGSDAEARARFEREARAMS